MPYAEVMYRCNAHYCINILRNRVILLVTLVAVAQLFMFSFYLHNSGPAPATVRTNAKQQEIHEAALFVNQNQAETFAEPVKPEEEEEEQRVPTATPPSGGREIVEAKVNAEEPFADRETGKQVIKMKKLGMDLLKNALKQGGSQESRNNVIGSAAKMLVDQYENSAPEMKKMGMNLLKTALVASRSQLGKKSEGSEFERQDFQKQNYAQIAKFGLDMLNNMNLKNSMGSAAGSVPGLLETAAKLMDGQPNNAEIARLGLNLLSNSLAKGRNGDDGTAAMLNMAAMMFGASQKKKQSKHEIRKREVTSPKEENLGMKLVSSAAELFLPVDRKKSEQFQLLESNKLYKKHINYTTERLDLQPIKPSSSMSMEYPDVLDIDYKFLINEPDTCKKEATYLFVVTSAVDHFERRKAARETWILDLVYESSEVKTIFLVGKTENAEDQRKLEEESQQYHDIIQADFTDTYKTLSLKSIALLKWINDYCPDAEHIVKCDDDVFINAPKMVEILDRYHDVRSLYGSLVSLTAPQRDPENKYFVSEETWPWDKYPPFLLGGTYIIGGQAVAGLLSAAKVMPLFELEDVYITGLCAPAAHIKRVNVEGLYHQSYVEKIDGCAVNDYGSWQTTGAKAILQAWKEAQRVRKAGEKCSKGCLINLFGVVCISS